MSTLMFGCVSCEVLLGDLRAWQLFEVEHQLETNVTLLLNTACHRFSQWFVFDAELCPTVA